MATEDEAQAAILDAIVALATNAKETNHHGVALKWATAANQLAEAQAWLYNPAQPHGGSVTFGDS